MFSRMVSINVAALIVMGTLASLNVVTTFRMAVITPFIVTESSVRQNSWSSAIGLYAAMSRFLGASVGVVKSVTMRSSLSWFETSDSASLASMTLIALDRMARKHNRYTIRPYSSKAR